MSDREYKDCEGCGNLLVKGPKKLCSGCYEGVKAKETSDEKFLKRIAVLEKRIKALESKK